MVSTVGSRPNHYETLGLKPSASSEEIARAFATELRRPRAFGGIAQVSIAYETLRDPIKRRAYDASIGLAPEPQPQPAPALSHWLTARAIGAPFLRSDAAGPAGQPAVETLPPSAPPRKPEARPEAPAEPRLASFLAASLREPAVRQPRHDTAPPAPKLQPEPPPRPEAETKPRPQPHSGDGALGRALEPGLPDADEGAIDWKRIGIATGALVATAGLLGIWAGWEAGNDIQPQQPERAVTVALPQARPLAAGTAEAPAPAPAVEQARPEPPAAAEIAADLAAARSEPAAPPPRPIAFVDAPGESQVGEGAIQDRLLQESATEPAAEAPTVAAVPASLPLPNRVVARTIERIGYACGQVASTTAVEGAAPGVFKVTCSSGNAYQARPVGGRYRFRRWGRQ